MRYEQGTDPGELFNLRKTLLDDGGMVVFEVAIELCGPEDEVSRIHLQARHYDILGML